MRSSSLATEDTQSALARTALGVVVCSLIVAVPLAARLAFGVLRLSQCIIALALSFYLFATSMLTMTFVFRAAIRREFGEIRSLVAASVTGGLASVVFMIPWLPLIRAHPTLFQTVPGEPTTPVYFLVTSVSDSIAIALCWAGVVLYPSARAAALERDRDLRALSTEAELLRLRAHLEPHFVLNTLNAIAAMVVDDPRASREMLGALGDLFRDASTDRSTERHTVRDEFSWLERYASIILMRYGDSVRFEWEPLDSGVADLLIPRLILQPIVENAVQHGTTRRASGGVVRISARREGDQLVCDVEDNGPGFREAARRVGAKGLSMVERRLALEAPDSSIVFSSTPGGKTLVRIQISHPLPRPSRREVAS